MLYDTISELKHFAQGMCGKSIFKVKKKIKKNNVNDEAFTVQSQLPLMLLLFAPTFLILTGILVFFLLGK